MAKIQPLHQGPIMPLAIMAVFALMIPILFIANNNKEVQTSNAMRMTVPTNEPRYVDPGMNANMTPTPKATTKTMSPKATPRGMMY